MFYRLGQIVHDYRWAVIAAWVAVAVALRLAAPSWRSVAFDGDLDQLPQSTTYARASRLNAEAFPQDRAKSQIVLVFGRADRALKPLDRRFAFATARAVERLPALEPLLVDEMWTERTPSVGETLASTSGQATRFVLRLSTDFMALDNMAALDAVQAELEAHRGDAPDGMEIGVTGTAAIGGDMLAAAAASLRNTDRVTILLVAATLAVIYRSVWLVLVPLAAIGVAAITSLDLLALLARWSLEHPGQWPDVRVFTTTRVFIVVLLFGAGTNFCLFFIARFRELRAEGAQQRHTVSMALERVGGAISASALTTIVGLAMMGFADFGKFKYSGPTIAMSLAVALAVCLTLAPALMSTWLGTRVSSGRPTGAPDWAPWQGFWSRVADLVVSRPTYVLELSLLAGLPLAWYGWNAPVTYDIYSELGPASVTRQGTNLSLRHFPPGDVGPLTILAHRPDGGLNDDAGEQQIEDLAKKLFELPGVDKVRRLKSPVGKPPGEVDMTLRGFAERIAANSPQSRNTFISQLPDDRGDVTRLFVVLDDAPFSAAAVKATGAIEQALSDLREDPDSPWRGATFELLGPTAGIRDLERVTVADRRRIEALVAAAVFGVVLVLLRQPLVCAYLIFTVLASYLVTLGAVRLIFEATYGADYPGLDWKAPLFLFVILVAVGQDYNIFLVTRVFEEQRKLGPLAGLREAVVQTGGIITSCGVIMAVTFGSMMTNSLRGMVEMGAALSLGVLIDTFIVRTIVVPAFLALVGRRGL